jgi:hypothetical protein
VSAGDHLYVALSSGSEMRPITIDLIRALLTTSVGNRRSALVKTQSMSNNS